MSQQSLFDAPPKVEGIAKVLAHALPFRSVAGVMAALYQLEANAEPLDDDEIGVAEQLYNALAKECPEAIRVMDPEKWDEYDERWHEAAQAENLPQVPLMYGPMKRPELADLFADD